MVTGDGNVEAQDGVYTCRGVGSRRVNLWTRECMAGLLGLCSLA